MNPTTNAVDFSKLSAKSLKAVHFLAAMAWNCIFEYRPSLPCQLTLHAENPAVPIAILYFKKDALKTEECMFLDYNEAEMFREGRSSTLSVELGRVAAA